MIKLSAIIPCYNFENYIAQSINSVLFQETNFEFDLYIIDDISTDRTYDLVRDIYGKNLKIKIFRPEKNQGITKNIKYILSKIDSEYVFLMDGDDYLIDNSYFQRAVDFLENNKNFSLYCTGYKHLYNNGDTNPTGNTHFISNIRQIELTDLLNINHVAFGRIFRNYKNLIKPWMRDTFHEDWIMNAEILKHGPAMSEPNLGGMYRITKSGRITSLSEEQIRQKNLKTIEVIKAHLNNKTITIIDSFVYNEQVNKKLKNTVEWMNEDGYDILLVSNTPVDKDIIQNVKFYLYDNRNQLFKEKYQHENVVDFWKIYYDGFEIHDVVPETQNHGLSVLINLFNAISYAKQQGYTHFQRFEVDDIFGEKSREYIKNVPSVCFNANKKGMFYFNSSKTPPDISFHYFYCEIDEFLSKVKKISKEEDYVDYLQSVYGNKSFKIVEVFLYDNIKINGDENILVKAGAAEMYVDFPDTKWNTETSISSFDPKYKKCITKLYHVNKYDSSTSSYIRTSDYIVSTYSYCSEKITRKIVAERNNGERTEIEHTVLAATGWAWNSVPSDVNSISVYENEKLLYTEHVSDCISYINIKS
jgi:glycosyltransferase involved in cell wall biosynthesis